MKIPSLTSLGLRSLREISDGSVYISNNVNLCYHHTVDWIQIFTGSRRQRRRNNNDIKDNKPQNQCGETSCTHWPRCLFRICAPLSVVNPHTNKHLLSVWVVQTEAEGHICDPLCSDAGCWGPGPEQCLSCRNHSRQGTCVAHCNLYTGSVWMQFIHTLCLASLH